MEPGLTDPGRLARPVAATTPATGFRTSGTHRCPACGTYTLPLAIAVRAGQGGASAAGLTVPIPNATQVGRWLKPPEVPSNIRDRKHDVWGSTFFQAITIVVILLTALMIAAILGPFVAIPGALLLIGLVVYRAKRPQVDRGSFEHDQHRTLALKAWDRRMEIWERLGVCPNCGLMSDPVTQRTAEWHSVPSLFVG